MPLQNTAPYNVSQHDDQGSSTSTQTTCLIVWRGKHLTVQANSATVLESKKLSLSQTKLCGTGPPGCCELNPMGFLTGVPPQEKRAEIFKQEVNAPDPSTYALPWRHAIWHFVVAFSHLPQPFPLQIEYLGSLLESAVKKGSPRSTPFFYLYQQHYCKSSNIFYI